jgi:hypothetical protein
MVDKPIKKADRVNPPAESSGSEAPKRERSNDDRGNRGPSKGGPGGGRGRGPGGDRDEKPAAVNPVFARGPKPPKKSEVVEAPVEEVTTEEAVQTTEAAATEEAAPEAATE